MNVTFNNPRLVERFWRSITEFILNVTWVDADGVERTENLDLPPEGVIPADSDGVVHLRAFVLDADARHRDRVDISADRVSRVEVY